MSSVGDICLLERERERENSQLSCRRGGGGGEGKGGYYMRVESVALGLPSFLCVPPPSPLAIVVRVSFLFSSDKYKLL